MVAVIAVYADLPGWLQNLPDIARLDPYELIQPDSNLFSTWASYYGQVSNGGDWVAAPVSDQTPEDIENAILTRARQLRLSNIRN